MDVLDLIDELLRSDDDGVSGAAPAVARASLFGHRSRQLCAYMRARKKIKEPGHT